VDICGLKCSKRRLEVRVSQPNDWWRPLLVVFRRWWPASHIHHNDKFDARICEPSIGCEALVDGLQETKVLINGLIVLPDLEDVEAGIEEEGKL
jgi:hypothetical protein